MASEAAEQLAVKCEERAKQWAERFETSMPITVRDLANMLLELAKDIREAGQ